MMTMANVDAKLISTLKDMATPTSIGMTIQGIFNNVMYGIIFPFLLQQLFAADINPPGH